MAYLFWNERSQSYGYSVSREAKDFFLEDQTNTKRSLKDFLGNKIFLFFGYIQCKTACPPSIGAFLSLSKRLKEENVIFIFISIDPKRDKQNSYEFSKYFGDKFFLLTGNQKQIEDVTNSYEIFPYKEIGSDEINHAGHIFLIDTSLRIRYIYPSNFRDISRIMEDFYKLDI